MRKFAIIGSALDPNLAPMLRELILELHKHHISTHICEKLWHSAQHIQYDDCAQHLHLVAPTQLPPETELVISIGGDGTFLDSTVRIGLQGIPLIGINTGRLGFLADNAPMEVKEMVADLVSKNYYIEKRSVIELVKPSQLFDFNFALNEMAVQKRDSSSMISIDAFANGEYINSYWADGLLIATPSGSTAYSLSVGGPIVTPQSNNFIITPIAPHSLNVRPIVISDDTLITLEVKSRTDNYLLALDSRSQAIAEDCSLTLRKAEHQVHLIKRPDHRFYKTLRNKLMWGADRRN